MLTKKQAFPAVTGLLLVSLAGGIVAHASLLIEGPVPYVYKNEDGASLYGRTDEMASVAGVYNGGLTSGGSIYLGNGRVLTAAHTLTSTNPEFRFQRLANGTWVSPPGDSGDTTGFRRIPGKTDGSGNLILQKVGDRAIVELDLSGGDTLSDVPVARISTQPIHRFGHMTRAEYEYGRTPSDLHVSATESNWPLYMDAMQSGYSTNGAAGGRRPRHGYFHMKFLIGPSGNLDHSPLGTSPAYVALNDSGGPVWILNQAGFLINVSNEINGRATFTTHRRDENLDFRMGSPLVAPPDVTGESGSGGAYVTDPSPGAMLKTDGTVDAHDAVRALAMIHAQDTRANFDGVIAGGTVAPSDVTLASDWPAYLALLANSEPNLYGPRNYLPLDASTLDIDGNGRLNEADAAALADMISSGSPPLAYDFDHDSSVTTADVSLLSDVIDALGHGVRFDVDSDGDADMDDADQIILTAGVFGGHVQGSVGYSLALDADVDGDNDVDDSEVFRNEFFPFDLGDPDALAPNKFVTADRIFDFVISGEDIEGFVATLGASLAGLTPAAKARVDYSTSGDPGDPGYGVSDGLVSEADLLWYMDVFAVITGTDRRLPAAFDANADGRTNLADAQWVQANLGAVTQATEHLDVNADGVLDKLDTNALIQLLLVRWKTAGITGVLLETPVASSTAEYMSYNHGMLGDMDNDPLYSPASGVVTITPDVPSPGQEQWILDFLLDTSPVGVDLSGLVVDVDCDDHAELEFQLANNLFAFDGRRFGNSGYRFTLDADLDGDNDADDLPFVRQRQQPADANGDGSVTSADWSAWIDAFNQGSLLADANRDNQVTSADFTAWINAYSNPCP